MCIVLIKLYKLKAINIRELYQKTNKQQHRKEITNVVSTCLVIRFDNTSKRKLY